MKRLLLALGVLAVMAAGVTYAATNKTEGRIGPKSRIQPRGNQLRPYGHLTKPLGNFSSGGAPTTNGRFLFTLSAGRGRNDLRVVNVRTRKVVQTLPMPGVSGGIAMASDGRTAYVSGTPDSEHSDQQVAEDVPGREGDVIHVLRYRRKTGQVSRDVVKNWMANYAARGRPYDFGVYSVTWPAAGSCSTRPPSRGSPTSTSARRSRGRSR